MKILNGTLIIDGFTCLNIVRQINQWPFLKIDSLKLMPKFGWPNNLIRMKQIINQRKQTNFHQVFKENFFVKISFILLDAWTNCLTALN